MWKTEKIDWTLFFAVAFVLILGMLSLYSISADGEGMISSVFTKQSAYLVIGLGLMVFFAFFDYRYFQYYSRYIYFFVIILLVVVLLFGKTIRGTSGWIALGPFQFQPVEFTKLAMIIFLASFISKKRGLFGEIFRIISSFLLTIIAAYLVIKQPDLGSAVILAGIWLGMILISGINKKNFFYLLSFLIVVIMASWLVLADYQKLRIRNFIEPQIDPQGSGYNVIQSVVAVGSGGLLGKGIGHGSQSQLNFIPEMHTDFIFAVIAEELGLFGAGLLLVLYGVILWRIKKGAEQCSDNFGYMLLVGIMSMFFLQILINIGMNIGIIPVTGIPLPLVSYGGSSLVMSLISVGIVLNILRLRKPFLKPRDFLTG